MCNASGRTGGPKRTLTASVLPLVSARETGGQTGARPTLSCLCFAMDALSTINLQIVFLYVGPIKQIRLKSSWVIFEGKRWHNTAAGRAAVSQ